VRSKTPEILPSLPAIGVEVARDRSADARVTGGFLDLRRLDLTLAFPDGTRSPSFPYDIATRAALDAVVFAACFVAGGVRHVYLRSAVRPPCALRAVPPFHDGGLWELPAGLIEPGEDATEAAARELSEELGFQAEPSDMRPLGDWTFPAAGVIGERHIFFFVTVDPAARSLPSEDGSALERFASIVSLPVADGLEHCRNGAIRDAKTELGLRRLAEMDPDGSLKDDP
jgi:ADP-ribose pyrophosphatase